jgi:hypothetical protein
MKLFFSSKYLASLLLVSSFAGVALKADDYANNDCCSRDYECGCNPLYECAWGLQIDAGVRPIVWRHRDSFVIVDCLSDTALTQLNDLSKFSKLFRVPWQVGVQVSYATTCNSNIFAEFNYAQAKAKDENNESQILNSPNLVINLGKYKLYEAYFGARYYFDRWCDGVSFFIGGKIGFIRHKRIKTGPLTTTDCVTVVDNDFFKRNTVVAGGGHVGFDICFCGNWSLVITGEVIASCGPNGVNSLALNNLNLNAIPLLFTNVRTELAFPVTFGVKYNF